MIDTKLLRQKILDLAIRGKLVPQDPTDEPASELLKKIKAEKEALVKAGKIKKDKHESHIFKGDDNRYYETIDGKTADITDEIPFDLPDNWAWCRMGDAVEFIGGSQPPKSVFSFSATADSIRLIQIRDYKSDKYMTFIPKSQAKRFCSADDIMIGRYGPPIFQILRGLEGAYNVALMKAVPCNAITKNYLYYMLKDGSLLSMIESLSDRTCGQDGVNMYDLKRYIIAIPPLAEQQRIVEQIETLLEYVDIIDADAETLEKSITLAKQKILDLAIRGKLVPQDSADEPASELLKKIKAEKDALVKAGKIKKDKHESFIFKSDDNCYHENIDGKVADITDEIPFDLPDGWAWYRLNSLYNFIDYRGKTPTKLTQGVPLITAKNIKKGFISYTPADFISEEEFQERKSRGISQKGDILFTTEAPLGNAAIADLEKFSAGQRIITFQQYAEKSRFLNQLQLYFILTSYFQDLLDSKHTGSTVAGIKAERLKKLLLPLHPLAEQKRIVSQIEKFFAVLETMRG